MQQSHLNKIAEAYNKIAEGKEPCPVHEKKDDKKKMHKCTCDESFYYKRLQAMNPEMAEMYLEIAEELFAEGYESSRLLDNIIEALSKEFVGHEFRSALTAVNPRIYENLQTAEKKQARVIAASFAEQRSCWKTHKKVGMKMKGGKLVNDCRPKNEEVEHVEEGATEVAMSNKETTLQKKKNKIDMMISRERNKELMKKEETVVEADMTGAPSIKDAKPAKKTNVKYDKHMKVMAPTVKEATYPSDFKNPDGSTRAVAKKKTGRPNAQGDYGKKDINEQDAADAKRMSTFQKLQKNVDQKRKLNIRGNDSAEQKARLERKRGMKLDDHPQFKKEEVELDENRRAARAAGGYKDDSKKQPDPSKAGFTGVGNMSIDAIRRMSARIDKEKTQKESYEKAIKANQKELDKLEQGKEPATAKRYREMKKEDVELQEKKKDDSYLETDMKKRQANNEKARKDMEKMGTSMKNPHFEHFEDLQPEIGYYDVILAYLDENNLMESVEEAEEIMMQLTGAQIVEIIDEFMNSKEESK